jgi:2-oxoglutarate ferredoxin oxidoreductase subunit alpha
LNPLKRRRDLFIIQGDSAAPLGLISWGSVAGVAMEALERGLAEGLHVKLLIPKLLFPVAEEVYQDFFASVRRGLVIEQSHQSQLYRLIRMYVDVPPGLEYLAKSGSNPILTREVVARIRQMVMAMQRKHKLEPEPQLG